MFAIVNLDSLKVLSFANWLPKSLKRKTNTECPASFSTFFQNLVHSSTVCFENLKGQFLLSKQFWLLCFSETHFCLSSHQLWPKGVKSSYWFHYKLWFDAAFYFLNRSKIPLNFSDVYFFHISAALKMRCILTPQCHITAAGKC
jgi:hypothetical protein